MQAQSQAALEIATLIASQPTPEQVVAFQPSPEVVARAYELVDSEREGPLSPDEQHELESYLTIQHIMILTKAEAQRKLQQRAS
jgi:hypothetical protein